MRRKEGFSLVELLIVLAVMAALIATITPVALNAIRKAKATQVGQNMKTLASAFENYVYVEGTTPSNLSDLGRDIDSTSYVVYYTVSSGTYTVVIATDETVDETALQNVVADITTSADTSTLTPLDGSSLDSAEEFFYEFSFTAY